MGVVAWLALVDLTGVAVEPVAVDATNLENQND